MKAVAVFPGERACRVVEVPEPSLRFPNDVKLRILQVGICGTDKEIMRFEYGTPPEGSDHLVLGHESLAEVIETGDAVAGLKPGDLAVLMVRRPCPHPECRACRAGRQDFCYTGDFTERGIKGANGFMTEFVVDQDRYVVPVPPDLRDVAVLTEPLTVAEKAFTQLLDIQERLPWVSPASGSEPPLTGRKGLVLGAGPVGLLGALKLVAAGCETVVYSREPAGGPKDRLIASLGAKYVSSEDHPVSQVCGVDVVYEAAGASQLAFEALHSLGENGVFIFTGVPGRKHPVEIDSGDLMRKIVLQNQVVLGTVNAGRDSFEAAIRDLAVFRERSGEGLRGLITGHERLEAFPSLDLDNLSGIKTVLEV
jgi:threonine dehydrogenase-like Zn-dependent dehydrogenase